MVVSCGRRRDAILVSDIIDTANDTADLFLRVALRNRQQATKAPPPGETGRCLNCEARVKPGRRWCDAGCRDQWEAERK